jgi:hypothetical protein
LPPLEISSGTNKARTTTRRGNPRGEVACSP